MRRPVAVVTVVLSVLAGASVASVASAVEPSGSVTVPQGVDQQVTYRTLKASGDRLMLVEQSTDHPTRVLVGTASAFVPQPQVPDGAVTSARGSLSGTTLSWWSRSTGRLVVTQLDTATGTTTTTDLGTTYGAAYPQPSGWLAVGSSGGIFVDLWTPSGATRLLSGLGSVTQVTGDADGFLFVTTNSTFTAQSVVQVDLPGGAVRTLTTVPYSTALPAPFDAVAQSPGTVAWAQYTDATPVLHRVARHGTAQTDQTLPGRAIVLAVTDTASAWPQSGGVAVLEAAGTTPVVHTFPAPTAGSPVLGGLAATSAGFVAARSGYEENAGVWTISNAGTMTRKPTPPGELEVYRTVSLSGGLLRYVATRTGDTGALRTRSVAGTGPVTLGPESAPGGGANGGEFSASNARHAAAYFPTDGTYLLVDDRVLGSFQIFTPSTFPSYQLSGPYVLVDGAVHSADDGHLVRAAVPGETSPLLDGSQLVTVDAVTADVVIRDVARPEAAPRVVAQTLDCSGTPRLSGRWLVLVGSLASCVVDLDSGAVRTVPVLVRDVADGVATWSTRVSNGFVTRYDVGVLDLTSPTSTPVTLGRSYDSRSWADSARVAWTDATGAIHVSPVTTAVPERPRLLGVATPPVLSPTGLVGTWAPAFELSERMSSVTVTIRRGTTVVRTMRGTAPDGSVRDVVWNGRNTAGTLVPDGVYTWTLTGVAADGSGNPTAVDGVGAATGRVTVDRTGTTTTVSVPATTATGTDGAGVPVSWTPAADLPGNPAVAFNVRYRQVQVSSTGAVTYGAARRWRTGTPTRSGTLTGTTAVPGSVWQFSAQSVDLAGNTGPWSTWKGTSVSYDDRALTASGTWSRGSSTAAYLGTESVSSAAGAALSRTAWGSRLTLVGSRCAGCGAVKVFVDGVLAATVDTQDTATTERVTLWSGTFPRARHTVRLVVAGTPGRPQVHVDALGFQLP